MQRFLDRFFFDFLVVTIPNTRDGKGIRRRADKDRPNREEDRAGEAEAQAATAMLMQWAVSQDLRKIRISKGSDGYRAGAHFGRTPVDKDRLATIRNGHASNMPGLEIPGGDGACAFLAPSALELLGPVNAARIDVSWDHSRPGYFDELLAYAERHATDRKGPIIRDDGKGRTITWSRGEATVKIYEKDLERVARKKLPANQADPNLVRVEFRFHPNDVSDKAGFARLARDGGPPALLGSVLWVRRMVEFIATLTGQLEPDAAQIAPVRLDRLPVSASIEDRARHGFSIYGRVFCGAALNRIVDRKFGGDFLAGTVTPEEITSEAQAMLGEYLDSSQIPALVASATGVDRVRSINEEAARNQQDLNLWLERQAHETEIAQKELVLTYEQAIKLDDRQDEFDKAVAEAASAAASEVREDLTDAMRQSEERVATEEARAHDRIRAAADRAEADAKAQIAEWQADACAAMEARDERAIAGIRAMRESERQQVRAGYKRAQARLGAQRQELEQRAHILAAPF